MNNIRAIGYSEKHSTFLNEVNYDFIQKKVYDLIKREYDKEIRVDFDSIRKVCIRILEERLETLERMNERVVMTLAHEVRIYLQTTLKALTYAERYVTSQSLWDAEGQKGHQLKNKGRPRLFGKGERVGGTISFNFFY